MTPSLEELLAAAVPFALRLRVPFRGLQVREGMLIKGPSGWGEFAPFDDYDDERAGRWLEAASEAAWGDYPAPLRDSVSVNAIVPAVDSAKAGFLAREAIASSGCTTIKVKVGGALADDEARVVAVRAALDAAGADGRIRLDANGAWTCDQAITSMRRLIAYGIEYVEQPCSELDDIVRLRSQIDVPVAADEAVRLSNDPTKLNLSGLVDYAILKPMTLGGAHATVRIASSVGVPVVVSGSLDTGVGLTSCLAAAAAITDLPLASGLGTGALFEHDLTDPPVLARDGRLEVRRYAPDLAALLAATDAIGADRAEWWRTRLIGVYAHHSRSTGDPVVEG
ncbi:MAG: o-succinylbenzoate synthase [Candidatus Nanopelagicales bacterium]